MEEEVGKAWVLLAASGERFLHSLKVEGQQHWWLASRRSDIAAGDRVFFWQAGAPKEALLGTGVVTESPYENPDFADSSRQAEGRSGADDSGASTGEHPEGKAHESNSAPASTAQHTNAALKSGPLTLEGSPRKTARQQTQPAGSEGSGRRNWSRQRRYRFDFRVESYFERPVARDKVGEHTQLGPGFLRRLRGGLTKINGAEARALNEVAAEHSRVTPAVSTTDKVPTHGDHPALRDALGREAFARVVAKRIQRLRDDEKWAPEKPSATSFLGFLQEKLNAAWRALRWWGGSAGPAPRPATGAFMLHIHGPWGSGKTSLLNMIGRELQFDGETPWVVVNFNAWRSQRLGAPWWSLLLHIYDEAREQLGEREPERARELAYSHWWWRVFNSWTLWIFAAAGMLWIASASSAQGIAVIKDVAPMVTVLTGTLAIGRSLLFGSARATNAILEITGDPLKPLVGQFRETIWRIGRPVVVFIDDLDRCDADYVVSLLHGIQTMFWSTQVAYVVAADRQWLRAAYETTYSSFDDYVGDPGRPLGYLFLEKLFQLSVSVPRLSRETRDAFWGRLIGNGSQHDEAVIAEAEHEAAQLVADKSSVDELLGIAESVNASDVDFLVKHKVREAVVVRLATPEVDTDVEHELQPFAALLEPNPRGMKRMVNAYGMHRAIDVLSGRQTPTDTLARWTIVELRWPLLAEYLAESPERVDELRKGTLQVDKGSSLAALKPLFTDAGVRQVIGDPPHSRGLTAEAIRECVGGHPAETGESTVA